MRRLTRITLTPRQYRQVAELALVFLTLIVFTGAAVRLSGSGLGCPDWPKCYGKVAPPLETHAVIEYGNRILSGIVGLAAVAAGVLAWRRRPFRRDLALIGLLLPLGVLGQAVLGGFTVRNHLAPGFVMGHYALSMLILIAAVALVWRARYEPGERPRFSDRLTVWSVRGLLGLGALTIFVGTAATAAGPHAGGAGTGDVVERLDAFGIHTLDRLIKVHGHMAAAMGIAAVALWVFAFWRRVRGELLQALTVVCVLLGIQGVIGLIQYYNALPAEAVWLHASLPAVLWLALIWSWLAARPAVVEPPPPTPPQEAALAA
jgi:heme a synthase